jgi:hypothetical protein
MSQVDERVVAQCQTAFAGTQMVGQQVQLRAHVQEKAPRLWNGISRVRVNLGTAIVGDPAQVNVASAVLPGLREAIQRES